MYHTVPYDHGSERRLVKDRRAAKRWPEEVRRGLVGAGNLAAHLARGGGKSRRPGVSAAEVLRSPGLRLRAPGVPVRCRAQRERERESGSPPRRGRPGSSWKVGGSVACRLGARVACK